MDVTSLVSGLLEAAWLVGSWALAPAATVALIVVVHELAHAAVARAVGFEVGVVHIGSGPAVATWWLGATRFTLCRWPNHGFVAVSYRGRRLLRTRIVCFALAGPFANVAVALALCQVVDSSWTESGGLTLAVALLPAWWTSLTMMVTGFVPVRIVGRGVIQNDIVIALDALRLDGAGVDARVAAMPIAQRAFAFDAAFLLGRAERAQAIVDDEVRRGQAAGQWHELAALLATSRGDAAAALASHERAAQDIAAAIQQQRSAPGKRTPPELAAMRRAEQAVAVNRAYYLVHVGTPAALAEAQRLADGWRGRAGVDSEVRVAMARTRGLVLLHTGRAGSAIAELRRALAGSEPYWLRALGFAYLALAWVRQGDLRRARRCARRARSLHPQSLLLPLHLREVDAALTAAGSAPTAALR